MALHKSKIEAYIQSIEVLRQELSFNIVISLRTASEEHFVTTSSKLDALHDDIKTIIRLFEPKKRNLLQAIAQHNDITEWCIELSGESSMEEDKALTAELDEEFITNFDVLVGGGNGSLAALNFSSQRLALLRKRKTILNLLQFHEMEDRFFEVDDAYSNTFDWIFEERLSNIGQDDDHAEWDSFSAFLRGSGPSRPYWINGKAGSGKSTLMKYIYSHMRTHQLLQQWAGSDKKELEMPHYFSWNLGSKMQKTYLGLFQTLLYHIVVRRQTLIGQLFPEIWNSINSTFSSRSPLTYAEVKRAFTRLAEASDLPFKICLFIDGIDEFEEDHYEVSTFLRGLASPNLKLVISSRPIQSCVEVFQCCPSLRLQDLTKRDIALYIDGKLKGDSNMLLLMDEQPNEAAELVQEILEMASGVFLWVRLVTSSLLTGLRNGDQIEDLQERVRLLPRRLEDLFRHMLNQLEPIYRRQASELFQIFRKASELAFGRSVPSLAMSFAESNESACLNARMQDLEAQRALDRVRLLQKRLRTRCCGLLEVHADYYGATDDLSRPLFIEIEQVSSSDFTLINSHVQYLHRTVAEYLHQHDVWSEIQVITQNTPFDVNRNLAHMSLQMIKAIPLGDSDIWSWAGRLIICVRNVGELSGTPQAVLLEAFDRAMHQHWQASISVDIFGPNWFDNLEHEIPIHGLKLQSLFDVAVFAGLHAYVDEKLSDPNNRCLVTPQTLHKAAFLRSSSNYSASPSVQADMVAVLLSHGANPDLPVDGGRGLSFWMDVLEQIVNSSNDKERLHWLKIAEHCISAGIDANAVIDIHGLPYPALRVVRLCGEETISASSTNGPPESYKSKRRRIERDGTSEELKHLSRKLEENLLQAGAREIDGDAGLWQLEDFQYQSQTLADALVCQFENNDSLPGRSMDDVGHRRGLRSDRRLEDIEL